MKWEEKIKRLMVEKNINQKQLAKMSGITESSISRYLNGERTPRIDIILNLAKAFDIDVEMLLDDNKIISPYESIKMSIARNGKQLSGEEQRQLVNLLLGKED